MTSRRPTVVMPAIIVFLFAGVCLGKGKADPFAKPGAGGAAGTVAQTRVITDVEFVDAPITTVFKMVSDLTGWSILMSPEVSKSPPKINLWIKNMSAEQVLQRLGQIAGLVIERTGNTVEVSTFDEFARVHGAEKHVVQPKNARARDIAAVLQPLIDAQQSKVVPDEASNRIVLLVPRPLLDSLLKLVEALDVPFEKDATRVVKLSHLEAATLAPKLEKFLSDPVRSGVDLRLIDRDVAPAPANAVPPPAAPVPNAPAQPQSIRAGGRWLVDFMIESRLNVIVLRGLPSDVNQTAALIAQLDLPSDLRIVSYPLTYTKADSVVQILKDLSESDARSNHASGLSAYGAGMEQERARLRFSASELNNQIIAEGGDADHDRLSKVIAAIDRPMPAGSSGIRIYRLENSTAEEVAKILQDIINGAASGSTPNPRVRVQVGAKDYGIERVAPPLTAGGATPTPAPSTGNPSPATAAGGSEVIPPQVTAAPEINAVVVKASIAEQDSLGQLIKDLDKPRDQVMLEVTLVTVRKNNTFNLGVELATAQADDSGLNTVAFSTFGVGTVDPTAGTVRVANPPPFGLNLAVFRSDYLSVVLNALKSSGDTRIMSAPKVLVEDNAQADIRQLAKEPYAVASQGNNSTITSFGGFAEAGTELRVVPHVSRDDWLRLEYEVNLSSFTQRTPQQLVANLPPPVRQNTSAGTVRVPSDFTVVLGGLLSTQNELTRQGIPILSDIPLVGSLFGTQTHNDIHETLFIFIRPIVMRDKSFRDLRLLSENDVHKAKLKRQDLPTNPLKILTPGDARVKKED